MYKMDFEISREEVASELRENYPKISILVGYSSLATLTCSTAKFFFGVLYADCYHLYHDTDEIGMMISCYHAD